MQITTIPFVKHIGIAGLTENILTLNDTEELKNHLGTLHAGALYTLAESQSGLCLMQLFPALEGQVIPLLREGSMKYKKAVTGSVYAMADVCDDELEKFKMQFSQKGRGTVRVTVAVKNDADEVCARGTFQWFIQKV